MQSSGDTATDQEELLRWKRQHLQEAQVQSRSTEIDDAARLATALAKAGIPAPAPDKMEMLAKLFDRAVERYILRLAAEKKRSLEVYGERALALKKHLMAAATLLADDDPAFRSRLESHFAEAARKHFHDESKRASDGPSEERLWPEGWEVDLVMPGDYTPVLQAIAAAADETKKECERNIKKRDAKAKKREQAGLAPLLPAIEGTALTELVLSLADVYESLTGQKALAAVKSKRIAGKSGRKHGPFADFVRGANAWRSAEDAPSGETIWNALKERG